MKFLIKSCVMKPWVENTSLNGVHVYKFVKFRFRCLKIQFANRQSDRRKCVKCAPNTQGGQAAVYDRLTIRNVPTHFKRRLHLRRTAGNFFFCPLLNHDQKQNTLSVCKYFQDQKKRGQTLFLKVFCSQSLNSSYRDENA
jgi:hypothetical protein